MTKWKGWKAVIRDIIMIWILKSIGEIIIDVASAGSEIPLFAPIGFSIIFLVIIGFCISGCLIADNRWKHLIIVAVFVWLTSIVNIFFRPITFTFKNWLLSILITFIMMAIGCGLSFLFVRPRQNKRFDS